MQKLYDIEYVVFGGIKVYSIIATNQIPNHDINKTEFNAKRLCYSIPVNNYPPNGPPPPPPCVNVTLFINVTTECLPAYCKLIYSSVSLIV